ncbi:hypothetical protein [Hyphomonas sp. ND6WE1B]|jgi:hypothetical protein|uniref:hypothetical protein n=1 Tax=Hyphomonas sp. ND6WE1B TaxID=1848191 RepID=UPI0008076698|nr:hypothetical protein [Hyphomonas sp. ND6WE1B]
MSVWFPFGFEQGRAAYEAVARLREAFPGLNVSVSEGRVVITGIDKQDEAEVMHTAAGALMACRAMPGLAA